jgi:hypothetical protein
MVTDVAQAGIASVSQSITAITKMAMVRCWTMVRSSIPKQLVGRFQTISVNKAVMANINAFLLLKSPDKIFFTEFAMI